MLAAIAERLDALAPFFAKRPRLRLAQQALEAIEAKHGLKGAAKYAKEQPDGDMKALAALRVAAELTGAAGWARSMNRLRDWVDATNDENPRDQKRLLVLFHREIDGALERVDATQPKEKD
jgi:hypothetical protein